MRAHGKADMFLLHVEFERPVAAVAFEDQAAIQAFIDDHVREGDVP